jgi:orotidine-5'-phosphate decarboxylase
VRVAGLGVSLLTVHGSVPVMQAAVEGRGAGELKLLAVTVLTSFDYEDLNDMGYFCSVADLVEHRVRRAAQAGVDGVVCSPLEVAVVREIMGPGAILVTPGVRSAGKESGGQKRVATPQEAIRDGANYLVIGRQITRAADPRSEVLKILAELGTPVVGR